ncbi:MAG TPA: hypothetical protein VFF70_09030, partial [Anaerolineae bacterium]|nr:hypothetical protein [Anaerolineae bacterium]
SIYRALSLALGPGVNKKDNGPKIRPTTACTPTRRFAPQRAGVQSSRGFRLNMGFRQTSAPRG